MSAIDVARSTGVEDCISFDMGGTSTDVSLVSRRTPTVTLNGKLGDWPVQLPMLDIATIGAGGGSIAWLTAAGNLNVGPRSAGATPGPVCYGTGGDRADGHRRQPRAWPHRRHHRRRRAHPGRRLQPGPPYSRRSRHPIGSGPAPGRPRHTPDRQLQHDGRHPQRKRGARPRPPRLRAGRLRWRRADALHQRGPLAGHGDRHRPAQSWRRLCLWTAGGRLQERLRQDLGPEGTQLRCRGDGARVPWPGGRGRPLAGRRVRFPPTGGSSRDPRTYATPTRASRLPWSSKAGTVDSSGLDATIEQFHTRSTNACSVSRWNSRWRL